MVGRVTLFIAAEGEAAYIMRTTESWIPGHASTADESGSSERELAYALTQSRLREATYEFAHRHRKRELDAYKNAVSDWKVFFGRKWLRKKVTGFIRAEEGQVRASGLLDPNWYCIRYPEAKRNPYLHYVTTGALDAADPHPLFDTDWYLKNNRFPRKSGINPLAHYITKGWRTGCSPHPLFDATWYMEEYPDVAQLGAEPLRYYITNGWQQGHRPSPLFDPQWYIERYPEVREGGYEPLTHFLTRGVLKGYSALSNEYSEEQTRPDWLSAEWALTGLRSHYRKRIALDIARAAERRDYENAIAQLEAFTHQRPINPTDFSFDAMSSYARVLARVGRANEALYQRPLIATDVPIGAVRVT